MDGPDKNPNAARTRHLRQEDVVEEVFKLGRTRLNRYGNDPDNHAESRCIIREANSQDTDVTVGEPEKLPLRIR